MTGCHAKKAQLSALVKQRKKQKENKNDDKEETRKHWWWQHFAHDSQDLISDLEVVGGGIGGDFYDQIDTYPMTLVS